MVEITFSPYAPLRGVIRRVQLIKPTSPRRRWETKKQREISGGLSKRRAKNDSPAFIDFSSKSHLPVAGTDGAFEVGTQRDKNQGEYVSRRVHCSTFNHTNINIATSVDVSKQFLLERKL